MWKLSCRCLANFDYQKWAYAIDWPQTRAALPLLGRVGVAVEDVKFAFNCWSLLRLCLFYGVGHPKVLSTLSTTTPSMAIHERGNYMFHANCRVGASLSPSAFKIALTPSHPEARPMHETDFEAILADPRYTDGIELVLGQENGLTRRTTEACDACMYLPQFGSIGSLSMINALGIALHRASAAVRVPGAERNGACAVPFGLQPLTETKEEQEERHSKKPVPHCDDLATLTDVELADVLADRRRSYPLGLALLWQNDIADRNLGASIRNANIYNLDKVVILNRKKFSRRGTVGTHHHTSVRFHQCLQAATTAGDLDGYELWLVHQDYPQHLNHFAEEIDAADAAEAAQVRELLQEREPAVWVHPAHYNLYEPVAARALQRWLRHGTSCGDSGHPLYGIDSRGHRQRRFLNPDTDAGHGALSSAAAHGPQPFLPKCGAFLRDAWGRAVFADDLRSLVDAVKPLVGAVDARGVMLVVPEEGATPRWDVVQQCSRVVFLAHPARAVHGIQRGLPPAVTSAIVMERLRYASHVARAELRAAPDLT